MMRLSSPHFSKFIGQISPMSAKDSLFLLSLVSPFSLEIRNLISLEMSSLTRIKTNFLLSNDLEFSCKVKKEKDLKE